MTQQFLWGALAMSSGVVALFFLRFFRDTRDRLFAFFSLAFVFLASHWVGLALVNPDVEGRHSLYGLRLAAFLIIVVAVVDRNRRAE
jgi:hypothetical protein